MSIFWLAGLAVTVYFYRKLPAAVIALITIPSLIVICLIGLNCTPEKSPMVNLFFPPDDLYSPLASVPLSESQTVYSLTFQHKYPGNHVLAIKIPSGYKHPNDKEGKAMLGMHYKIFDGSKLICEENYKDGIPAWGIHKIYAFWYWYYKVPQDLPRSVSLQIEITLLGDVAQFLEENKGAKLVIGKKSDE